MDERAAEESASGSANSYLYRIRPTTWPILILAAIAYCGSLLLVNTVLFRGPVGRALGSVIQGTGFFINSSLIGGLVELFVLGAVVFGIGRLRGADLGWTVAAAGWGLAVTFAFWVAMQGVLLIIGAVAGDLRVHSGGQESGWVIVTGGLVGQLFGNALVEETGCRGFFLPQFYLKAAQAHSRKAALVVAVVGSSVLFAVAHIPNRLWVGNVGGTDLLIDQIGLIVGGLIFAAVYLVTRNLFVAVGLHALLNDPVPIAHAAGITLYGVWFGLTVLLLIMWPLLRRRHILYGRHSIPINPDDLR